MDLKDLRLYALIAQTGSLSAAAREAGLTVAAVSARLKRMESETGVQLITRTTRSLRLTAEGEHFLQTCEAMSLTWARGTAMLRRQSRALEGQLRVAAPSDTALQLVGPWLGELSARNPTLVVTLLVGDRMHNVQREAVDIAIRYGEMPDSSMVGRTLCSSERVLVASPQYLQHAPALDHPEDLRDHRCLAWLRRDQPNVHWSFGLPNGQTQGVVVAPVLCGDGVLVRRWALAGLGVAYKARIDVEMDLRAGRLVRLLSHTKGEPVQVRAVMPGGRYPPGRVKAAVGLLKQRFEELVGSWAEGAA